MLIGNNGILVKTGEAKLQTDTATIKDQIHLDILAAQADNNGKISIYTLASILEKYGTIEATGTTITKFTTTSGDEINVGDLINNESIVNGMPGGEWNGTVNMPDLESTGLTPVVYGSDGEATEVTNLLSKWYDYNTTSDGSSMWANAVTKDSSGNITGYFVWIPRYEYQITNTNDSTGKGKVINVKFIPKSQTTPDSEYVIHPAFTDGTANNFKLGEWDEEISGFWVAKYPAGYQANTITDNNGTLVATISNPLGVGEDVVRTDKKYTSINNSYKASAVDETLSTDVYMSYPVFTPLTYAYNNISTGDIYTLAKEVAKGTAFYGLSSGVDSHMLKNSEWGAVAYLTQSNYGRHGTEPIMNGYYTSTNSPYKTAVTGLAASNNSTNIANAKPYYDTTASTGGIYGSSTGNITGVYDLNGCISERVAGYITNGTPNLNNYKGASNWVTTTANPNGYKTLSTKYATVYPYGASNPGTALADNNGNNWTAYKNIKDADTTHKFGYGDGVLETSSSGSGSNSWHSDNSHFVNTIGPFFLRGCTWDYGTAAGVFAFDGSFGHPSCGGGFRVVLVGE